MYIPSYGSLYPELPWFYQNVHWCIIPFEVDPAIWDKFILKPLKQWFEKSSIVQVFAASYSTSAVGSYAEVGIMFPARYGDIKGASFAGMYVNNVPAICAGRELFGIPKKWAEVTFEKDQHSIFIAVKDKNMVLIEATLTLDDMSKVKTLPADPRLQVRETIMPDGSGFDTQHVLRMDFNYYELIEKRTGKARLKFGESEGNPLGLLEPHSVNGGIYGRANFDMSHGVILNLK